jgi:hypothetical protein
LVIFCVLFTVTMRLRIAFRLGIGPHCVRQSRVF